MKPAEIYSRVLAYSGRDATVVCDLHSACSPLKRRAYMCPAAASHTPVIDFDEVKVKAVRHCNVMLKSVDALALPASEDYLCLIELKSWEMLIERKGTEENVRRQADKYASALPRKLTDSIRICEQIAGDSNALRDCRIIYILLTDISVETDGLMAFSSDLTALACTSSNLREICNTLSQGIMDSITSVETRYWECRRLDAELSLL